MDEVMKFPKTVEEFMEQNKVVDTDHVYSNGIEFVPIFRMKQWFEHTAEKTGTWTEWKDDSVPPIFSRKWRCSCCGESNGYGKSKYCPKCGARMEQ